MIVHKFFIGILGLQKTITLIIHDYFLKFFPAIFKLKPLHQSEAYAPTHIIILLQSLTFSIFVINFNKNLINGIKIIIFDIVKLNPPQKKNKKKNLEQNPNGIRPWLASHVVQPLLPPFPSTASSCHPHPLPLALIIFCFHN